MKRLFGALFGVVLALGAVMGTAPREALAVTDIYTNLIPTSEDDKTALDGKMVMFNDIDWYIIEDNSESATSGSVTLFAADVLKDGDNYVTSAFDNEEPYSNKYSESLVKTLLDGMTSEGGSFAAVASAIKTIDVTTNVCFGNETYDTAQNVKLYILSMEESYALPSDLLLNADVYWSLRSPGLSNDKVALVFNGIRGIDAPVDAGLGVRPACQLNLESVVFDSGTKTFELRPATCKVTLSGGANATASGGETTQEVAAGEAMADVTYTANDGYKFPEASEHYKETYGITVARTSDTVVTVSGTPITNVEIAVPDAVADAAPDASVTAHVQRVGWMAVVTDDGAAGTVGMSRRMEALTLSLPDGVAGGIEYRCHLQKSGWEKTWAANGGTSGTVGESRRVEAVQVRLTGAAANTYDVYYRVHVQKYGWMAWAKNGESAGTQGMSRRAEAIQVVLVRKDTRAPDTMYMGVAQQYDKAFVRK